MVVYLVSAQLRRVGCLAYRVPFLKSRWLALLYINSFVLIERQSSCLCFQKKKKTLPPPSPFTVPEKDLDPPSLYPLHLLLAQVPHSKSPHHKEICQRRLRLLAE